MRQNLLETYARQLNVAENYVAKNFDGRQVSNNTKLTTAVLLENTNKFMTESVRMNESVATMRSDLGDWKKFCLNLTNIAVPSLIANDLVIVHPMTSFSGSVAYLRYVSSTNKGGVKVGDEFNSVFGLGKMNEDRMNFTAQAVVEEFKAEAGTYTEVMPVWNPIKSVDKVFVNGVEKKIGTDVTVEISPSDAKSVGLTFTTALAATDKIKLGYKYNQEYIPANDIPTIGPKMERIALTAEPRRIAVKYDQITAYQAKTDYGFSLDKQIAEQACGELAYKLIVA